MAADLKLITDNLDLWTSALLTKSTAGRGSGGKEDAYGIKKLRALILELAVRGKLVPQDPNDEPASVLFEKIAKEKKQLAKARKIKKPKELSEIAEDEQPFCLQKGWEYVRLNDLGEWGAGATPSRGRHEYYGGTIPWFKSGELTEDYISQSEEHVTELALKEASLRYNKPGDVLIAMYGATIGKTSILTVAATTNQAVCACTPFTGFSNTFLLTLLKAYKNRFIDQGAGGAQPNISREKIIATVIGLPPLAEQHRIVAKVDELMALCDQLEQQQTSGIEAHQTLVSTLLATLTSAASPEEFAEAWSRIADHFGTLFTTELSIDQLKQTILQLAVMGKLVPQDPNDEPAGVLLERIAKEKERLVKEGKIKKEILPVVSDKEIPFDLPNSWRWARLGVVGLGSTGKTPGTGNSEYYGGEIPFVGPGQITPAGYIVDSDKTLTAEGSELSTITEPGDVLMVCIGGSIGKSAIAKSKIAFNQQINCLRPILLSSVFLNYSMNTPQFQASIMENATGSATPIINRSKWEELLVSLPPLAEQHRIVAKVDELMALCDSLKSRLAAARTTQIHLADAIVEQSVA